MYLVALEKMALPEFKPVGGLNIAPRYPTLPYLILPYPRPGRALEDSSAGDQTRGWP